MTYLVKGWASKPIRDTEDHLVALKSLTWTKGLVPLLHEHEEGNVAGKILELKWYVEDDAFQGLHITCEVEDVYKDVPAFSARFAVREHEIVGKGRDAYAIVKRGVLREVSLVQRPACKSALVTYCEKVAPTQPTPVERSFDMAEYMEQKAARDVQIQYWLSQMTGART